MPTACLETEPALRLPCRSGPTLTESLLVNNVDTRSTIKGCWLCKVRVQAKGIEMISISHAHHPREGAWAAFLAYDTSLYSDSSCAWCWAVYHPDGQGCFAGHSRSDQPSQSIYETRVARVHEVLQYCDSKPTKSRIVDLYVEAEDQGQFVDLARDWSSLDVVVRLIGYQENPARLLKRTNKSQRLSWL